jgi:hypothetical protein
LARYPSCAELREKGGREVFVAVNASLNVMRPEEIFSMLSLVYGVCAFLGLVIHVLGVGIYLEWPRGEGERLKEAAKNGEGGLEK